MKIIKTVFCVALCITVLWAAAYGTVIPAAAYSVPSLTTNEDGTSNITDDEVKNLYHDTYGWVAVPMVSQELLDAGYGGGEGCQAVNFVYCAPTADGELMFMGTDVGGMYRSYDGGNTWAPCGVGFEAAGATGFICDPTNTDRVFCVGTNSGNHYPNGIWRSIDAGLTWEGVLLVGTQGFRDSRTQIGFDVLSYDEKLEGCKIIYWSRENTGSNGIYKSTDGGDTWTMLPNTEKYTGGYLYVNPENGAVLVGTNEGIYISYDGGENWNSILDIEIVVYNNADTFTMDYVSTFPDNIYVANKEGFYVSKDFGETWEKIYDETYNNLRNPSYMKVSPIDPDRIVLQDDLIWIEGNYTENYPMVSHDGGHTWTIIKRDISGSWVPSNTDYIHFTWSTVDADVVMCNWCYLCKSVDGGYNFVWCNTGYNGICNGGKAVFNVNDSNLFYLPSQDYNGGYTTDGGQTWTYLSWQGKSWGGYTYGGYALSENVIAAGVADKMWGQGTLWVTYDGGKTYENKGIVNTGAEIGCGVLGDPDVAFVGNLRTDDGGYTWTAMRKCNGVYTVDYSGGGAVFGRLTNALVVSTDKGVTWTRIASAPSEINDIAYDYNTGTVYVVAGNNLHEGLNYELYSIKIDKTTYQLLEGEKFEKVEIGDTNSPNEYQGVVSVSIDPNHPEIVYAACGSTYWFNLNNIWRSMDGGETWECLSRTVGDGRSDPDGGRQPRCIRVNQNTGELFVICACRGIWKISGPVSVYGNGQYK